MTLHLKGYFVQQGIGCIVLWPATENGIHVKCDFKSNIITKKEEDIIHKASAVNARVFCSQCVGILQTVQNI